MSSLKYVQGQILAEVFGADVRLMMTVTLLQDGIVRVKMDEKGGQRKRYEVQDVLIEDGFKFATYEKTETTEAVTIDFGTTYKVIIYANPFSIDYLNDGTLVAQVNKNNQLNLEPSKVAPQEGASWSETFGSHTDSVKYGPMSIGVDVTFPGSKDVFGIPEHATNFNLKETGHEAPAPAAVNSDTNEEGHEQYQQQPEIKELLAYAEPYRLYNLDVFEFELDSPIALYGSVPLIWSHKKARRGSQTVGFFWLNAAETWVDVKKEGPGSIVMQSTGGTAKDPSTTVHWMSETGVFDFSVLLGPSPQQVQKQYAVLTGGQVLPQMFSIAYHQCRWNYMDTKEVDDVNQGFEEHGIPMDVIWLDIEHTDDKKYFTWHADKFAKSIDMIKSVAEYGRKVITIIDPHIKRVDGYHVKDQASSKGMFVRNKDGGEFEGWCWPGSSSWVDFLSKEARIFWAKLFNYSVYQGSSEHLFTWNDMNEPSVFNGPEITMPKDNLHSQDVEHRDIHNIYGMLLHRSTYGGHIARSLPSGDVPYSQWTARKSLMEGPNPHRPFILSRAFFAGTQRYGAIWTGDNMAKWSHLQSAVPMLLSVSLGGIGHCGVDVGGFFLNPDAELLTRWYQAGAYYPFFRAHAHLDTRRREPWLFGEPYTSIIREAITIRYKLLPYWYTLFRRGQVDGASPLRPVWFEYPNDAQLFNNEDQFMVGEAFMVKQINKPLLEQGDQLAIYLPGNDVWFNWHSHIAYRAQENKVNRVQQFTVPLKSQLPSLLRAGQTVPTRERVRRSSLLMAKDPLTLTVALDQKKQSQGEWYLDDGESFGYAIRGEFVHKSVITKLSGNSMTIIAKDVVYDDTQKSKRMKPFQRPFLGENGMTNDKEKVINWEEAERVMTLSSDSKYKDQVESHVKVERIVVLAADDHSEFKQFYDTLEKKTYKTSVNGKAVDVDVDFELVVDSEMHGHHVAQQIPGVQAVFKLVIKKPQVGAGLDWELKLTW